LCGTPFALSPDAAGASAKTGEKLMRNFASAFLSATAAVWISGLLFSTVLV